MPPPAGFTIDDLVDGLRHAARQVAFHSPHHPDRSEGWSGWWGDPDKGVDVRPITTGTDGDVTDGMVAGYLAKYATKSTEATGHTSTRLTADTIGDYADPRRRPHRPPHRRLLAHRPPHRHTRAAV